MEYKDDSDSIMDITNYIPHKGKMLLLDKLISANDTHATAMVIITQDSLFITEKGVPASIGIEYMAQTVAAYSGFSNCEKGSKPKIGLLLGSRQYESSISHFCCGDVLKITVNPLYVEVNSLGVFSCEIHCNDIPVVKGTINVLQPERVEDYF